MLWALMREFNTYPEIKKDTNYNYGQPITETIVKHFMEKIGEDMDLNDIFFNTYYNYAYNYDFCKENNLNCYFNASSRDLSSKEERKEKVIAMLSRVGLDEKFMDRYPRQLSGGQRQRVCIAGALMLEPSLLIADEPVSALDVTIQAQILELFQKIHEEMGLSILFISHDLRVVYQMCDRILIMQHGQIMESGTVEEVYFHHKSEYTGKLLDAAGIEVD